MNLDYCNTARRACIGALRDDHTHRSYMPPSERRSIFTTLRGVWENEIEFLTLKYAPGLIRDHFQNGPSTVFVDYRKWPLKRI